MTVLPLDPPGASRRRRIVGWNVLVVLVAVAVVVSAIAGLHAKGQLAGRYWRVLERHDLQTLIWQGVGATLKAAVVSMLLAMVVGLALAAGRLSRRRWVSETVRAILEVLRGLPVLMLIFLIFLGLPAVGVVVSSFWALVLGISLYNGALIAEVYRGGILALPRGQTEAGVALGLSGRQVMSIVLLPQAIRIMMPALVSQLVVVLKETSLGYIVGYLELLRTASAASAFLGARYMFPVFFGTAVVYIAMSLLLSLVAWLVGRRSTRRFGRPVAALADGE